MEKSIQKELKKIRKELGYTMSHLGVELGITRQQVWNLEHGQSKMSRAQALAILYLLEHKTEALDDKKM